MNTYKDREVQALVDSIIQNGYISSTIGTTEFNTFAKLGYDKLKHEIIKRKVEFLGDKQVFYLVNTENTQRALNPFVGFLQQKTRTTEQPPIGSPVHRKMQGLPSSSPLRTLDIEGITPPKLRIGERVWSPTTGYFPNETAFQSAVQLLREETLRLAVKHGATGANLIDFEFEDNMYTLLVRFLPVSREEFNKIPDAVMSGLFTKFETELYRVVETIKQEHNIDKSKYSGVPVKLDHNGYQATAVTTDLFGDDELLDLEDLENLVFTDFEELERNERNQQDTVDAREYDELEELEQVFSKVQVKTKPNTS